MSEENVKKTNKFYPDVNPNPDFPAMEREILADWQADDTFEKSVEKPADGEFVFYDGPPFANGLPHYGHLLTGFVKDTFARYQTMQGKRVERRFGWDCHGLPAEMGSEKELGISGRGAIQAFGIDKFNEHCRTSVMKYTADWREYVTRQARWVDFDNDYKTMDKNFMESVLWAFKQLYDKGLVYEAHRVMPYSWAAETPLSNFETKLDNSYREREDKAITVAFELNEKPAGAPDAEKYYILAWTTTPWTLPSNLALGVNKDMEYSYILSSCHSREGGNPDCYIVAKSAVSKYAKELGIEENKPIKSAILETERLYARPFTEQDLDLLYGLHSSPDIGGMLVDGVQSKEQVNSDLEHFITHQNEHGYSQWAIFEKASNIFVGRAGIILRSFDNEEQGVQLRYALHKQFWGKGYATEISKACINWGFKNLDVTQIVAGANPVNISSHKVLKKSGLKYIKNVYYHGKECVYYVINREEFIGSKLIKGSDLIGLTYKPLFPYFADRANSSSCGSQSDSTGSFNNETARCTMRPFTKNDVGAIHELHSNQKVREHIPNLNDSFEQAEQSVSEWMEHQEKHGFSVYAIIDKATGKLIGRAGLKYDTNGTDLEYGIVLNPEFWGKGISQEILEYWLAYGFLEIGVENINGYIRPKNVAATHICKKYGREFTAHIENYRNTGTSRDCYSISKKSYLAKDPALLLRNPQDDTRAFRILDGSSFVTDGDGTGIVHLAPAFGEEDQKCCEANGIELVCPVDGQGKYTDEIFDIQWTAVSYQRSADSLPTADNRPLTTFSLRGLNVIADKRKEESDPFNENQIEKFGLANLRIIKWLKDNKKLIKEEQIKHNYPHCWRTDTPLIYRAMPSWYVEVTKFRDRAAELNQQINWIPAHIRDGQMGHMLKTAPDWSISRNRFWGTPIPVWRSKSSKIIVIGSIAELEELSGEKVTDLHRPYIDNITISKDGEEYTRVEDVFDCWFESGSMPFAQVHYPFENKDWFEKHFPADFITEYVGQTRGWFNTLIMLSTALFDKPPFKNCICHGVMLGEPTLDPNTGKMVSQKLSKRLKNYPEPFKIFDEYGADALRWFMLSSSVMRGNDLQVDKEGKFIRDVVRLAIKPIWNAYNFFTLYANADGIKAECGVWSVECGKEENLHSTLNTQHSNIMDSYILAKMNNAVSQIEKSLDAYDTPTACDAVLQFFDALNNWYIRRNKERFWKSEHDADKQAAYDTLYTVLVTMSRACAPLLPLTMEEIYKGLTKKPYLPKGEWAVPSVHLGAFPDCHPALVAGSGDDVVFQMDWIRDVCNAALAIRSKLNIRVRQPLNKITISSMKGKIYSNLEDIIKDELNIKFLDYEHGISNLATLKLSINSAILGKRLPEKMKQILPASKKGEWKRLDSGDVEICGEVLLAGEYTLQLEPKPEYAGRAQALSTNDALVILDTQITPELEAEGLARDIVRMIQQARKDADLNVSDKIRLHIYANKKIAGAVASHQAYILEQVLAVEMLGTVPQKPTFVAKNELDGAEVVISFVVCA